MDLDMPQPWFDARPGMYWAEYRHAEDNACPDPERLRYDAHQWVETPDNAEGWPGVQCGGCGEPLEPVTSGPAG